MSAKKYSTNIKSYQTKGAGWLVVDVMIADSQLEFQTGIPAGTLAVSLRVAPGVYQWFSEESFRKKYLKESS